MNWLYLFSLNFFSVCNANFLKHCIIFISITWTLPEWITRSQLIALESAALVLPYIFISPLSGRFAKIHYKTKILQIMKAIEFPIVFIAAIAFCYESIVLALLATLLLGLQACLYSPAKYGVIHDIDGDRGAAFGSGMFEAMAFIGILIGTVIASFVADHYSTSIFSIILISLAAIGYLCAHKLHITEEKPKPDTSTINPIKYVISCQKKVAEHKGLGTAIFGASFFWFIGSLLQMNIILHGTLTMNLSNTESGILLAIAATGIALGCFIAGKIVDLFKGKNTLRNIGLVGLTFGSALMGVLSIDVIFIGILVFATSFCGGLFQIPCLTAIQRATLGRDFPIIMAYTNMMTFIFILISSGIFSLITLVTNQNSHTVFICIATLCTTCLVFLHLSNNKTVAAQ